MRSQWGVVSLCLLSPSAWALMSKHCKEPVYKQDHVRYVCWYSNTRMPTAYEYHLKEMKKNRPRRCSRMCWRNCRSMAMNTSISHRLRRWYTTIT